MAFVFGSAASGERMRPDSDVDIAVWLKEPPSLDDRLDLLGICQDTLQYDDVDLVFLNSAGTLLRYEVLKGRKLFIRDMDLYAGFFSETFRYYEDDMMRMEKNRRIWEEVHREKERSAFAEQ